MDKFAKNTRPAGPPRREYQMGADVFCHPIQSKTLTATVPGAIPISASSESGEKGDLGARKLSRALRTSFAICEDSCLVQLAPGDDYLVKASLLVICRRSWIRERSLPLRHFSTPDALLSETERKVGSILSCRARASRRRGILGIIMLQTTCPRPQPRSIWCH